MKAISRKRPTAASGCIVRIVGLVFFLVGLGVFVGLSGIPLKGWFAARDWPAVPCTITSSEVASHSSSDGTTYSIQIRYAYEYEGRTFEGTEYNFFGGSSSGYDRKQAVVDRYPAGATRECFVNPEEPAEAVLNRDFSFTYLIGCFGLIFLLIGLALLLHRAKAAAGATASGVQSSSGPAISHAAIGLPAEAAHTLDGGFQIGQTPNHGPVALKGGNNSRIGFAFMLVFALIWNGIVSAAAWDTFSGGFDGVDLFTALFLVPFLLIGLAALGGVVYFFLTLFNPRVDLTMDPGQLNLGGAANVAWSFRGNAGRISKLTITLQGQEAATYRRGTSTSTDRSIFEKIPLVEVEDHAAIQQGHAVITVPEFTAPSFDAPNNKIQWQIKVHGEIASWPDVNEEFEVIVLPLPVDASQPTPSAEFRPHGVTE